VNALDWTQIFFYVGLLVAAAVPLGAFMARVFAGERTFLSRPLGWLERLSYRAAGIDESLEMGWLDYAKALLWFNFFGFLAVFGLQLAQAALPFNPQGFPAVSWHSALNTAVSFVTNTDWQGYGGEATMSYLAQALGLAVQNFLSAATGMAVFLALARGIARRSEKAIGNFWVDMTRATVYVLLPLSLVLAVALVSQGVVQTFSAYPDAITLEGAKQALPLGPAASQIAIKQIGTNGGGFFNANSAHPFENPTPLSNFLEMLAILLLPAALPFTYGRMVKAPKQAWTIFAVMLGVWLFSLTASIVAEYAANPIFQGGGIMEGKETRLGVVNSLIWSTSTTVASNGSVNAMHASLSPLAGGLALFNIMMGEVIFGGAGAGMYGMLLFVLLTVFLAGLMVGRSPEYLGKKIEAAEMKMAILGILGPCAAILIGAAVSAVTPAALASLGNKGPHGLTEILYAFTSAAGNNGSAFAGLNANTPYYNLTLSVAMLVGRFVVILPALAIAGSLAAKKAAPPSAGTFETDTPIFAILLVGVIVIVGALTFVPALALGPVVEHFLMMSGQAF
jgi:K+-transporting ATPase ATPase A chain